MQHCGRWLDITKVASLSHHGSMTDMGSGSTCPRMHITRSQVGPPLLALLVHGCNALAHDVS
jgi:hypothetical protein